MRLGFLVGTRVGNVISFRYSQVSTDGYTANGYCMSRIFQLADGRLDCHEEWEWENRTGSGTSVIRELRS